ncbi:MAG: AraC family transcriptional regulator [Kiritimatiellales bacterium]|nr:AraC family transcriptional regulator [Kiritimatiellales bacterium]
MKQALHSYVRYLPVEKDALAWGLHVIDCGITDMAPGAAYPTNVRHPPKYLYQWEDGRTLSEFQIVYITKGAGLFESRRIKQRSIGAGDVLLLFPGEWHRYGRNKETGWDECWVGFSGEYAKRLMTHCFGNLPRVLHVGFDISLFQSIRSLPELLEQAPPGYQQLLAANTTGIIAQLRSLYLGGSCEASAEKLIQDIRMQLTADIDQNIDFRALADSVGMSYSKFRAFFKERTGFPPRQYIIEMRINRAKELLTYTNQNISVIADVLGFESLYYFSRLFKFKTGLSPSEFRAQNLEALDADNME